MAEQEIAARGTPSSLDDLAALGPDELMELYIAARTPQLKDLAGRLTGRMLAVPRAQEPHVAKLLRAYAGSGVFTWQGKTFEHYNAEHGHGHGINRVLGERLNLFKFETSIGPSRAGEFDAIQLDYDHQGNPSLVRAVKDEVREVAPGLWLGVAYLQTKAGNRLGVYFGLARA